jgi:hypothetical protein
VLRKNPLFLLSLLFACITCAPFARTQNSVPEAKSVSADQLTDDAIALMRQDIRSKKKQIVAANMTLTDTEATKFWVAYDKYTAATIKLNDTRYALVKEYAVKYGKMTDEDAKSFITRWLQADENMTKLRLQWIPEFEKIISPAKTALFFQIDRRVGLMVDLQLASQVPLLNP